MTDDPEIRDAFDAEQAVLGALMLGGDSAFAKVSTLRPEHMTDARHRWLMGVLLELHAERTPCDAVTVAEVLERRYPKRAVELAGYVLEVANGTPGSANIAAYAAILARRFLHPREYMPATAYATDGDHDPLQSSDLNLQKFLEYQQSI
jgi:replicative DNA helicase